MCYTISKQSLKFLQEAYAEYKTEPFYIRDARTKGIDVPHQLERKLGFEGYLDGSYTDPGTHVKRWNITKKGIKAIESNTRAKA